MKLYQCHNSGGYRWCDLPYYTEQLTAVGIAKYTGSSTGNIVQSTGSGNALNKALFHHAVYGAVQARAQFNALNGLSDRTIKLSLTNQYGSPIEDFYSRTASGLTDTSFDVASSGTYYLTISGQSMLRKKISISLTPGSLSNIGTVSTYLGDVNGDNVINSADTALISNYLGVSTGSTRWVSGDETLSWTAEDCDLNGDGTVNTTDLAIAQANLNVVGD